MERSVSRPQGVDHIVKQISLMTRYSRQDVLRILQISLRQLVGWERAGLIPQTPDYGFPELSQLRTLRELQHMRMSPASIRNSVQAMQAVSGLGNPLLESAVVRTGTRLAFRYSGTMVDPIRRQLLFDFEAATGTSSAPVSILPSARAAGLRERDLQTLFLQAVQAEEQGRKPAAMECYNQILAIDPVYTAALINLGTLYYHQNQYTLAENLYRRATEADASYVLAFFDLGNVLDELQRPDESIAAYTRAITLAPGYADAHYNLALAYERKGERRRALAHWQVYVRLDKSGPWTDHARGQIRKILSREKMAIAHRSTSFQPQTARAVAALALVASRQPVPA
jgi:tetratricopeptide (TPR) repeat protein